MNLQEAQTLAEELMRQHGLTVKGWRFAWDNSYKRAGACRFHSTTSYPGPAITLSRAITQLNDRAFVTEVLLHEIAHALAGPSHHHDAHWKETARKIGCTGDRCHTGMRPFRILTIGQLWAQAQRRAGL